MILTEGAIIKTKELAKWFGISYDSFRKNAEKKYEELENFCDYDKKYGYIIIKKVYIDIYIKNYNEKVSQNYFKYVYSTRKNDNNRTVSLGSLSGITRAQEGWDDTQKDGVNRVAQKRNRKARNNLFGDIPSNKLIRGTEGAVGSRTRVWAILEGYFNSYRYLNEKEQQIFQKLSNEYYQGNNVAEGFGELNMDYQAGEIPKEIYDKAIEKQQNDFYNKVVKKFKKETGKKLVRIDEYLIKENECSDKMIDVYWKEKLEAEKKKNK